MTNFTSIPAKTRSRLLAAVASVAIAGAVGFGAAVSGTAPVMAQAVRIDTPQQQPGFGDVVEKVSPAVVSVRVKSKVEPASDDMAQMFGGQDGGGFENLPPDHPLQRFFREFRGEQDGQQQQRQGRRNHGRDEARPSAQGSGFFISDDGYVVTNNHVIQGGVEFTVVANDGKELTAKLVGADARTDLALLKVDNASQKFTYVDFADDSKVRVGDWVVAVGNPFGLGGTVTAGIVSARGRDIGAGPYDDFIQIDAAVNRGNSGGPAFNLNGQVVGINTAIFSPGNGGNVGIAFAIPASTAKQVIASLKQDGSVSRGWLGVEIQPVTQDIADSLGLDGTKGALVSNAQADGPGKDAGIKAGDVITQVDGKEVTSPKELARLIGSMLPGKQVDVTLWRGGKAENVKLTLGKLPGADKEASAQPAQPAPVEPGTLDDMGLTVTRSDDGRGLVVTDVDPESDAADRGIQAGDVITSINSMAVASSEDVDKALAEAGKSGRKAALFQITRDDSNRFVALPLAKG